MTYYTEASKYKKGDEVRIKDTYIEDIRRSNSSLMSELSGMIKGNMDNHLYIVEEVKLYPESNMFSYLKIRSNQDERIVILVLPIYVELDRRAINLNKILDETSNK